MSDGIIHDDSNQLSIEGKSWFLGIGIDHYQHLDHLNNAVKDVKDVLAILKDRFDIDHAITLFDEDASRKNIIKQFESLVEQIESNDKLLVYFAGHGQFKWGQGYWIPYDGDQENTANYLANEEIISRLKVIKSRHTLVLSDSCFSGSFVKKGKYRNGSRLEYLEKLKSRWVICSGQHNENVYDGDPGKNSPFATHIIDVLKNSKSSNIGATVLSKYILKKIKPGSQGQMPVGGPLGNMGDNGGQYVFHAKGEKTFWNYCKEKNDLSLYTRYLKEFPTGKYAAQAVLLIENLEEELDWKKTRKKDRLSYYFKYLNDYEDGKFGALAHERIKELEPLKKEEKALLTAEGYGTKEAFQRFLQNFPDTRFREEVESKIAIIESEDNGVSLPAVPYTDEAIDKSGKPESDNPENEVEAETERFSTDGKQKKFAKLKRWVSVAVPLILLVFVAWVLWLKNAFVASNVVESQPLEETESPDEILPTQLSSVTKVNVSPQNEKSKAPSKRPESKEIDPLPTEQNSPKETVSLQAKERPLTIAEDSEQAERVKGLEMGTKTWSSKNLEVYIVDGTYCYNNQEENCEKYGRLYTWNSAREACTSLGKGWRLPSDEEWKNLAIEHGGYYDAELDQSIGDPKKSFLALSRKGGHFVAVQAGYRYSGGDFDAQNRRGIYWSGTKEGDMVWVYDFTSDGELYRYKDNKTNAYSCRCIKD